VIDRINGQSDALSSNSAFQSATSNLPSDRYGTIYLNFRALASASGASGSLPSTFLNIYPTAVSYLEWTQAGIRWQTALKAAQSGAPAASLSGDATSLAAMVPQNASVFAGVSNLGGLVQSFDALGGASGGSDPLQAALGVPSTDTSLQQGAAIAAFGGDASSSLGSSGAFLIHEPSAANANSLLTALENQANNAAGYQVIQLVPTQVGSVSATNIESTDGRGLPFGLGGSSTTTASDGNYLIATEAYISNTMVVASSTDALQSIINVSQGSAASLAHASAFKQLVSNAPSSPALTTYVDLSALQQALGPALGAAGASLPTASLLTLVWDSTQLQFTADVSLNQ
jgi:hypothetical protein